MGRFSGNIGFVETVEMSPGVFAPEVTERRYIVLNNDISIVADKFSKEHLCYMRYVVLHGLKWEIVSAVVEYPRIRLTLGGLYNG